MSYQDVLTKHHGALVEAQVREWPEVVSRYELEKAVPEDTDPALLDGHFQKAALLAVKARLEEDLAANQLFHGQVKNPLLQQLLTAARVKELARVRIVKRGGRKQLRYDINELRTSFYGKQLVKSAGLERQRVLDKAELDKLVDTCAKVKLVLPESVEPTTTERFFE